MKNILGVLLVLFIFVGSPSIFAQNMFSYTEHQSIIAPWHEKIRTHIVSDKEKREKTMSMIEKKLYDGSPSDEAKLILNELKDFIEVETFVYEGTKQDISVSLSVMQEVQHMITSLSHFPYRSVAEMGSFWWIDRENMSIMYPEPIPIVHVRKKIDVELNGTQGGIHDEHIRLLVETIRQYMMDEGFAIETRNSSQEYSDDRFVDYILAFSKDNVRCKILANPENGAGGYEYLYLQDDSTTTTFYHMTFSCVDVSVLEAAREEQIPLIKAWHKYIGNDDIVFMYPGKRVGDFVMGKIGFLRTGAVFQMVQIEEGVYEYVGGGHDVTPCENFLPYVDREGYNTMLEEYCADYN